jgi:CRP-like cAMP-binding protein
MSNGTDTAATEENRQHTALTTAAARNLATTTKTPPQMAGITSRWLLRMLPWIQVSGGAYRVNRRLTYAVGRGRVGFVKTGDEVRVAPPTLTELPALAGLADSDVLAALADRFVRRDIEAGRVIASAGEPVDQVLLLAHGKVGRIATGKYGEESVLGVFGDGDHFGDQSLADPGAVWQYTAKAVTACTLLALQKAEFAALAERSPALAEQIRRHVADRGRSRDRHGQAQIELAAGHQGEPDLPTTFVDYELAPREYELSVAQTVLRVHSRVADLYNQPMNQVEQQLRLTVEALRERQEHEMVNNRQFGLLHNADFDQRVQTHGGPPTPDDLDELLSRRRDSKLFLAHPRAIAAFGRECNRRGLYPDTVQVAGHEAPAWRGVPILPCTKIPIDAGQTTSILVLRTGEDNQGVVALRQTGLPDEVEPGLNVRFMGIDEKAVISYLVSTYYSVAVLVPDALGVLENVEIARPRD